MALRRNYDPAPKGFLFAIVVFEYTRRLHAAFSVDHHLWHFFPMQQRSHISYFAVPILSIESGTNRCVRGELYIRAKHVLDLCS